MSHSAGWSDPDDRSPSDDRDIDTQGFPPATSWVPPEEDVDGAPSGGWGTPGPHLTGPIPRIRATSTPTEAFPNTSASAPTTPPAPQSRSTWAPEATTAPRQPSQPPREPRSESEHPAPPASEPASAIRERRGLGSLFDFGFVARGTRTLVPIVYGLVVTYAVLVFFLDLLAALGGVGIGAIVLDLVRALLVGGIRFLLTLGVARILCEMALHVLVLMERQPR